ncbi:hypothetical protein AVEN_70530-1 [Araneus ventricosus]|uniref:Uncharacterized protein n=1 Tax=Araneus ventricosus TaxID=182803 RepID=A0A4Y2LRE5_ARAVE|nr:hypothetical protein AVEN_70530-1 [Araneus ventricosus]
MKCSQEKETEVAVLESSTTDSSNEENETEECQHEMKLFDSAASEPGPSKAKRGRIDIITPELATVLDRTKVSDRKAVFVVAKTAKSLGYDIKEVGVNRSMICQKRNVPFIVHWDGKLLPELTGKEKIDMLPIIISGKGVSQMLFSC